MALKNLMILFLIKMNKLTNLYFLWKILFQMAGISIR
jgi:hypothetical protein